MTKKMLLGIAITLGLGVVTLLAVDTTGTIFANFFELGPGLANSDGSGEAGVTNILGDGNNANGPDWGDIMKPVVNPVPGGPRGFFDTTTVFAGEGAFLSDDVSAGSLTDRTTYSGGPGDKNSDIVQDWTWATSSVPAKDDVGNAYVWTETVNTFPNFPIPDGHGGNTYVHKLLFVGVEREDPSGDSHVDIEFFKAAVGLDRTPPCPKNCFFTGSNTDGDLLVNMDFLKGGGLGSVSVRRRDSTANNNYTLADSVGGEGCSSDLLVCAFNNGATIKNGGWNSFDNHAAIISSLTQNSFTEFGVDVTGLGFGLPCFSTVEVKTRSSQSFTASLKDFAIQPFQACFATIATKIHSGAKPVNIDFNANDIQGTSISVGGTVHDMAIVTGQAGVGNPAPTGTVTFRRFTTADCTGTSSQPETVALTKISDATASSGAVTAAESTGFTPGSGSLSYQASYSGDSNYNPPASPSECEVLTINKLDAKVITDILNSNNISVLNSFVANGTTIHDEATVYGLPVGGTTLDPTGQVTFRRFTTADCSGTAITPDEVVTIVADGTADGISRASSQPLTPNAAAGSFICYKASYGGDANYNATSVFSTSEPICAFTAVPKPQP
jgi:hypothetical protein